MSTPSFATGRRVNEAPFHTPTLGFETAQTLTPDGSFSARPVRSSSAPRRPAEAASREDARQQQQAASARPLNARQPSLLDGGGGSGNRAAAAATRTPAPARQGATPLAANSPRPLGGGRVPARQAGSASASSRAPPSLRPAARWDSSFAAPDSPPQPRPTSTTPRQQQSPPPPAANDFNYHGPGMTAGRVQPRQPGASAADAAAMAELQRENVLLSEQVAHLQQLLSATASPSGGGGGDAREAGGDVAAAARHTAACMRRSRAQVVQLQRQVALMAAELQARNRIVAEAESTLLEVAGRLEQLTGAALDADSAAVLSTDQWRSLYQWGRKQLNRLQGERSAAAKLMAAHAPGLAAARGASNGGGGLRGWAADEASLQGGQRWEVPYVAAAGNAFLLQGSSPRGTTTSAAVVDGPPTWPQIVSGQGALLADAARSHHLEAQLAALAPRLGSLAVLLRASVLPAMPWLSAEGADRLQSEAGEVAAAVGAAANELSQLTALLPAAGAAFGPGAGKAAAARAKEEAAGRDSWLWSQPNTASAGGADAPPPPPADFHTSPEAMLQALAPYLRDKPAVTAAVRGMLDTLFAGLRMSEGRAALLQQELEFCCRNAALQAQHVSHLMLTEAAAFEEAGRGDTQEEARVKAYYAAAQAMDQVLDVHEQLERDPSEACLKLLVDTLGAKARALHGIPALLKAAPNSNVEVRIASKLAGLNDAFRAAVARLQQQQREQQRERRAAGGDVAATGGAAAATDEEGDAVGRPGRNAAAATAAGHLDASFTTTATASWEEAVPCEYSEEEGAQRDQGDRYGYPHGSKAGSRAPSVSAAAAEWDDEDGGSADDSRGGGTGGRPMLLSALSGAGSGRRQPAASASKPAAPQRRPKPKPEWRDD